MTPSWPTPGMSPCSAEPRDALLLPTTTHPEATGIFVHSFQYAQLIRDHLTQEPLGVVILNISEVSLYSQYLRHQSADNRFFLTDGSGTIVSARDKQLIGSIYAHTPRNWTPWRRRRPSPAALTAGRSACMNAYRGRTGIWWRR